MLSCQIKKTLGQLQMDCAFDVKKNELLVVLGPSGCGKSSLLNMITGMMDPDEGLILHDSKPFFASQGATLGTGPVNETIQKRKIGYIQQKSYLFPHMSVRDNILYAIPKRDHKKHQEAYESLLHLLGLEDLETAMPATLSGGQAQRVAIGRALMLEPAMILWDEPFSALDHMFREDMRQLVKSVQKRLQIPMVFVTHDLDEAYQLADTMAIMDQGKFLQVGTRDQVFGDPNAARTARMLGFSNMVSGVISQEGHDQVGVDIDGVQVKGLGQCASFKKGQEVMVGIRPEHVLYVRSDWDDPLSGGESDNVFSATILDIASHMDHDKMRLKVAGIDSPLTMSIPRAITQRYDFHLGDVIDVLLKYKQVHVFPTEACQDAPAPILSIIPQPGQPEPKVPAGKGPFVVGISGVSGSGKTTLMVEVIHRLVSRGYRVGTIKHDGHDFQMDQEGKDSYRHGQAGAGRVILASRSQVAHLEKTPTQEAGLETLIERQGDMDIVLFEGYKYSAYPKYEVVRQARSCETVCDSSTLLGVVTDCKLEVWDGERPVPILALEAYDQIVDQIEQMIKE